MRHLNRTLVVFTTVVVLAGLAIPAAAQAQDVSYLIIAEGNQLPKDLVSEIQARGGTIARSIPEIGILVAEAPSPDFAAQIHDFPGIRAVVPNVELQWFVPGYREAVTVQTLNGLAEDDEFLAALQWGHIAVDAPGAWERGYRGAGARVAVLDSGFDLDHVDLYANVNFDLSANFTDETLLYSQSDVYSHGTHVAGAIAAADNGFGLLGVAPDAELVLTKVVRDDGSGTVAWLLAGIVKAVEAEADIINLSLGAALVRQGYQDAGTGQWVSAQQVTELVNAMSRATSYAYAQGTTVIAAAGDYARDGGPGTNPDDELLIHLPAEAESVLTVAATTPVGWATGSPDVDLDTPTRYSNYGDSFVDLAAPGGGLSYAGEELCEVGVIVHDCFVFDLILSTGSDLEPGYASYYWAEGTGVAAAYASGVAALIVSAHGGKLKPSLLDVALRQSSDDLGKPGRDDFYGYGRVNAGNYVK